MKENPRERERERERVYDERLNERDYLDKVLVEDPNQAATLTSWGCSG
jgi:hypothetical protein